MTQKSTFFNHPNIEVTWPLVNDKWRYWTYLGLDQDNLILSILVHVSAVVVGQTTLEGHVVVLCAPAFEISLQERAVKIMYILDQTSQVWQLTQFFLFPFCKLSGKTMTPHWGKTFLFRSYQQLPRLCLKRLKGFFSWQDDLSLALCASSRTTERPFLTNFTFYLPGYYPTSRQKVQFGKKASCFVKRNMNTVRYTRRRSSRTPSETTKNNMCCAFVENALVYTYLWLWKVNREEFS